MEQTYHSSESYVQFYVADGDSHWLGNALHIYTLQIRLQSNFFASGRAVLKNGKTKHLFQGGNDEKFRIVRLVKRAQLLVQETKAPARQAWAQHKCDREQTFWTAFAHQLTFDGLHWETRLIRSIPESLCL